MIIKFTLLPDSGLLQRCSECGAAVSDTVKHREWHNKLGGK